MNEMLAVWLIGLFLGFGSGLILGCRFGFKRGVEATEKRWADFTRNNNVRQRHDETVRRAREHQGKSFERSHQDLL